MSNSSTPDDDSDQQSWGVVQPDGLDDHEDEYLRRPTLLMREEPSNLNMHDVESGLPQDPTSNLLDSSFSFSGLQIVPREKSSNSSGDISFTGSTTQFERQLLQQLRPGARRDAAEEDRDIHGVDDARRIEVFKHAIPQSYTVLDTLGSGHNGVVFSAKQTKSDGDERMVAIKFLSSRKRGHMNRKLREIAALSFLPPHPNIIELLEKGRSDEGYEFFVMELCDLSLHHWIRSRDRPRSKMGVHGRRTMLNHPPALGGDETLRMLHELTDAILTLRSVQVAHQDIKPHNILLRRREDLARSSFPYSVKLADFGVVDMHIQLPEEEQVTYENAVGTKSQDDFRAATASVFFAWLPEPNWESPAIRANLHSSDGGFYEAISHLALEEYGKDHAIFKLFRRILPIPESIEEGTALAIDGTMEELERLGKAWNVRPVLKTTPLQGHHFFEGSINDSKLDQYAMAAIEIVKGKRKAKDWNSARSFLDRARRYMNFYNAPTSRWSHFYFQSALTIELPRAQDAVRSFTRLVKTGQSGRKQAMRETDMALESLETRIDDGIKLLPTKSNDGTQWGGVTRPMYASLKALYKLEVVKYEMECENYKVARKEATGTVSMLMSSLKQFTDDEWKVLDMDNRRLAFQHIRNEYMHRHELMKIAKLTGRDSDAIFLAVEAAERCKLGVDYALAATDTSVADRLEMQRCLAESLYVSGDNQQAREICIKLYRDYSAQLVHRSAVLRVLAIWVACLRAICKRHADDEGVLIELGVVCQLLIHRHHEAAEDLIENSYFYGNALAFLASDKTSALAASADPLLPIPLLPHSNAVLSELAAVALEAVHEAKRRHDEDE